MVWDAVDQTGSIPKRKEEEKIQKHISQPAVCHFLLFLLDNKNNNKNNNNKMKKKQKKKRRRKRIEILFWF